MKKTLLAAALTVASMNALAEAPKYVFYFIGDGLAASQRQVTEYYLQHKTGNPDARLVMNSMPVAGITTTHAFDSLVTDSAASATALATGVKTHNGVLGLDSEGKPVASLLEGAAENGMRTGLITTTRLTHATPAGFAAKNESRNNENEIAMDYVNAPVDFFAGGGYRNFVGSDHEGSRRTDDKDLVAKFDAQGFDTFIGLNSVEDFMNYKVSDESKVFAAFTASHLPYEIDRQQTLNTPSLAEITYRGIEVLSQSDDGFFMMVEGGRIDHASHAQDLVGTIYDALAFDAAIAKAVEFYNQHPEETLIVVIGDHETGGLGMGFGQNYFMNMENVANARISIEDSLQNQYDGNRDAFFKLIARDFKMDDLTDSERDEIVTAMNVIDAEDEDAITTYGGYDPVAIAVAHIQSRRSGIYWTSFAHTGTLVPLSAMGKGAEHLGGFRDNTQVAQALAEVMQVDIGS